MTRPGRILPTALRSLVHKPATIAYPYIKTELPPDFRGKPVFDSTKCIGCKMCMRDCPSGAIEIIKVGDKEFKAVLRMDKCLFCAQCVDSCNKDALHTTPEYELANYQRNKLKVDI